MFITLYHVITIFHCAYEHFFRINIFNFSFNVLKNSRAPLLNITRKPQLRLISKRFFVVLYYMASTPLPSVRFGSLLSRHDSPLLRLLHSLLLLYIGLVKFPIRFDSVVTIFITFRSKYSTGAIHSFR